ncbi:MAG TPA: sigma-70 family RNA polymerase sigma factor [Polyangiaceae bacterium]|nr:sigma-70 family RNA polymerase sigma factor [Polyangiaceae bacterium]
MTRVSPLPDEVHLIERARAGDEAALTLLVETYAPRVLRFAQKLCGPSSASADAEDVLQQTLVSVISHIDEFRGDSQFASWLYAIARSHCIKQRTRGAAAHPTQPLADAEPAIPTSPQQAPDENISREQLQDALNVAIDALEPAQREVLVLRDIEGLGAPDVAQALGISVDAVKSRLHRARKTLRERLTPWFEQSEQSAACPDVVDLLSRYQEGDITSEVCQAMQAHVDGCPQCAKRCHSLRTVLSACSATPVPVLSPEMKQAVQEQVRRSLRRQRG